MELVKLLERLELILREPEGTQVVMMKPLSAKTVETVKAAW